MVVATTNPNNLSALFFYRVQPLIGINDISGAGTLPGSSCCRDPFTHIPGYNSAGNTLQGARYFIGARLTYDINRQHYNEVLVTPDFVTVRPQPRLELSYFITRDVRANDPFTLGVRIKNIGLAPSNQTRISPHNRELLKISTGSLLTSSLMAAMLMIQHSQLCLDFRTWDAGGARFRSHMESSLAGIFWTLLQVGLMLMNWEGA